MLYSFAFDGLAVRGFYVFLEFSAAFFYGFIFLGFQSPRTLDDEGRNTPVGRVAHEGSRSRCCGGSPLFAVLSFVMIGR